MITQVWKGEGSLVKFVAALNFNRRNLNESQNATVALDMLPMLEAEAKEAQRLSGGDRKSEEAKSVEPLTAQPIDAPRTPQSREQAATTMGIGKTIVTEAKRVARLAPERMENIKQGKQTVGSVIRDLKANGTIKSKPNPTPSDKPTDAILFAISALSQLEKILASEPDSKVHQDSILERALVK